ncbi:MAG: hypothetical protein ACKVHA_05790 [Fidelibacterota bacterium]|jgi:hypothetical protein|tara:strand:+ start:5697 stop:6536 length:840 start_codon:yes stop_codon:yes gene_type:complete
MNILDVLLKFSKMDRRWIFLIIGLSVLLPLFFPIGLPIRATGTTQRVYDTFDSLEPNSKVLLSCEYGPSTKPEIHPMVIAVLHQLFRDNHKVYVTCLWPDGQFLASEALREVAGDYGKVYGEDYVILGYRPGSEAVIKGMVRDLRAIFSTDVKNTKVEEIPMMEGVYKFEDFDFLFSASAGFPGSLEWMQYATDNTNVKMSTGTTSIMVNDIMPFVVSNQIQGILAGMPGAAEYEKLVGKKGVGTSGMDAQSFAHLVIVFFIVFGNIGYFIERKKNRKY